MKIKVNWQDIEDYIKELEKRYKDKDIKGVYGLPRGRINICSDDIS